MIQILAHKFINYNHIIVELTISKNEFGKHHSVRSKIISINVLCRLSNYRPNHIILEKN